MILEEREDVIAGRSEISAAAKSQLLLDKILIAKKIQTALNERRDAYNDIVDAIISILDTNDSAMIDALIDALLDLITCHPMKYGGKMFLSKTQNRLISERPLFILDLFERLIDITDQWSNDFESKSHVLRIQILALKSIRRAEQNINGRPTLITKDTIDALCLDAIFKCDDSTKVDILNLIFESRGSTRPFQRNEIEIFEILFRSALNFQEPGLRQVFLAVTNKIIRRIKDSHRSVMRDTHLYSAEKITIIHEMYMNFLKRLVEYCFDNIYCNAYFGSFVMTISTLKFIVQIITFSDENFPIAALFSRKVCYDSLLSCISDSFEENKAIALELFFLLPRDENIYSDENLELFENIAYQLAGSVNPAHSLTCQYVFKLAIGLRARQSDYGITKNKLLILHSSKLVDSIEDGILLARTDFFNALRRDPIYPKLSCIRALLNDVHFKSIEEDRIEWEKLIGRVVKISIETCELVSDIVCNLNPETIGHLPMDLKPIDAKLISRSLNAPLESTGDSQNAITSQMLLICGWKTIKECSLSFGALCQFFWWPQKLEKSGITNKPILNAELVIKIIQFFDHYLRNLRHRGAFEQAYNGFSIVTRRIWLDENFRNILIANLKLIMSDLDGTSTNLIKVENLKAYVTRRSAGLPFIVQAIVNSEHRHDSQTLRWVIDCLTQSLDNETLETYQRIHCLNILRALIKEHSLGEKVLPYVGKTLILTMRSFSSEFFPIRNCANMLLKATLDRAFGVNRLKNDIHRRNQLSFERFFTECPGLHDQLIRHLNDGVADRKLLAAVHAAFIVLFRLRPSLNPGDGFSAESIIRPFVKPVYQLALRCPDLKIRELAAKLFVRLRGFCREKQSDDILMEFHSLIYSGDQDFNRLHGLALIVKHQIEADESQNSKELVRDVVQAICFGKFGCQPNALKIVALDIIESWCINLKETNGLWLPIIIHCIYKWVQEEQVDQLMHESLVMKSLSLFFLLVFRSEDSLDIEGYSIDQHLEKIMKITLDLIIRKPSRVLSINLQAALIRFIRQQLSKSPPCFVERFLDDLDMDSTVAHMTPFDKLKARDENDSERDKLASHCSQNALSAYLARTLPDSKIFDFRSYAEFIPVNSDSYEFKPHLSNTPRAIELLALAYIFWDDFSLADKCRWDEHKSSVGKLNFLINFASSLPDCDIKHLVLLCASKQVTSFLETRNDELNENFCKSLEKFSNLIDELADGYHSSTIRRICVEVLSNILKLTLENNTKTWQASLINLLSAAIKLSQDEERDVRTSCQNLLVTLQVSFPNASEQKLPPGKNQSCIDYIIRLVITQIFDPDEDEHARKCFQFLMMIMFDHSDSQSRTFLGERERLFDRTKVNTFVDHIATIHDCIEGLENFFSARQSAKKFNLKSLVFPESLVNELVRIDSTSDHSTGDYSWRLKKMTDDSEISPKTNIIHLNFCDNNQIVDQFLENLLKSLDYYKSGYSNMLIDTEYTYQELSLFKRIAFTRFVLKCTDHKLRNESLAFKILDTLRSISDGSCCTTLIHKCCNLIAPDHGHSLERLI